MKPYPGKRFAVFLHDITAVHISWLGAYWLRFNLEIIPQAYLYPGLQILVLVVIIQGFMFWYFGLHRGVWRYASIPDLLRIGQSIVMAALPLAVIIYLLMPSSSIVPRSILPIYSILLLILLGGPRLIYRWSKDYKLTDSPEKKALIIGAGDAGEQLVRDLIRSHDGDYVPMGFLDDDKSKHGREIHGLRVIDTVTNIHQVVVQNNIDLIIIAIPSASHADMKHIVEACEHTLLPFITMPKVSDVISGKVTVNDLREVSIEDLLGRDPVSLDWQSIRAGIAGRAVFVTGGGGSIGSELCRQICRLEPQRLLIIDHNEYSLYQIEQEIRRDYPGVSLDIRLINVSDYQSVSRVIKQFAPDIVFHAAAYKHVPILEAHIREAVLNNVIGTKNTIQSAIENNVSDFILISTDKAVNPTSIMGATKRISEIMCQVFSEQGRTRFITVRFGNVLNSAGSVVPLFRKQIEHGGPLTVTHPDITRYFMTIPEACQLILQSKAIGKGGEIFVLDMGESVKISYLAEQMILLSGKEVGREIEIIYTGLRPGEKLYEELFYSSEVLDPTNHHKIRLVRSGEQVHADISDALNALEQACCSYEEARITEIISALVPEYQRDVTS